MTLLSSLSFVEYKPQVTNPILNRRRKLVAKIEEQERLASDSDYAPTKMKWTKGADGADHRVAVPKRVKRWWVETDEGKALLTVRYGSKPIEFAKGKAAIALSSSAEVAPTLAVIKKAVLEGELDAQLGAHAADGGRLRRSAKKSQS